jgi:hypothetical protein
MTIFVSDEEDWALEDLCESRVDRLNTAGWFATELEGTEIHDYYYTLQLSSEDEVDVEIPRWKDL